MSLYGSNPRYTNGVLDNAKLLKKVFPGWKLRIYLPQMNGSQHVSGINLTVPKAVVHQLKALDADLIFMDPFKTNLAPMMWRFLVANDVTVDRFIVRDADSRLITRDAVEVKVWIQSGKPFHCIRDHPGHAGWPISGGLWGGVPLKLQFLNTFKHIFTATTILGEKMRRYEDMKFLRDTIWPKVKYFSYCSDSFSCKKWESSHPFSTSRSENLEFVGEVTSESGKRGYDFKVLEGKSFSPECIPR